MQSITQENDLDAFLSTAALAETDFTAGKIQNFIFRSRNLHYYFSTFRKIKCQGYSKRLSKSFLDF